MHPQSQRTIFGYRLCLKKLASFSYIKKCLQSQNKVKNLLGSNSRHCIEKCKRDRSRSICIERSLEIFFFPLFMVKSRQCKACFHDRIAEMKSAIGRTGKPLVLDENLVTLSPRPFKCIFEDREQSLGSHPKKFLYTGH